MCDDYINGLHNNTINQLIPWLPCHVCNPFARCPQLNGCRNETISFGRQVASEIDALTMAKSFFHAMSRLSCADVQHA